MMDVAVDMVTGGKSGTLGVVRSNRSASEGAPLQSKLGEVGSTEKAEANAEPTPDGGGEDVLMGGGDVSNELSGTSDILGRRETLHEDLIFSLREKLQASARLQSERNLHRLQSTSKMIEMQQERLASHLRVVNHALERLNAQDARLSDISISG